MFRETLTIATTGRGFTELTAELGRVVAASAVAEGLCHLFVLHTSASLLVCENADPQVLRDLEHWMAGAVPDGDRLFAHTAEGPDDMPAHVRSVLTQTSLTLPVSGGRLLLGTWQGIYLWEHRHRGHRRRCAVTVGG